MVNKTLFFIFLLGLSTTVNAELTVNDINNNQQNIMMLKAALERSKLEKELTDMTDSKVSITEACVSKGVGQLTLRYVYGVSKLLTAAFSYNTATQIEAKIGDTLPCGESIKKITLDKVEVEKEGQLYSITGTTATLISPKQPSPALTQ